jgi:hypothetical protein
MGAAIPAAADHALKGHPPLSFGNCRGRVAAISDNGGWDRKGRRQPHRSAWTGKGGHCAIFPGN